ncbi:formyl transferase-like protein [Rubrobacter xylanophilus DSM 9941]|uniref:Formyl transferase-like protein n=1 Tax=Rubrobacter xylanophilus (strain DSM 9941 / JCM 11954 / NBRC 16129 / PRD-1) TaxID=266117 RepID=Q1AUN0_RUBXD|nr:formyl transferase [Rubrobacter xylanophilus]ABG04898.1 formyl transferase-like protein [Rubrobacter xylanophilus DSM 9941]
MRVAFFTSDRSFRNEVFRYMYAHVAHACGGAQVVAVRRPGRPPGGPLGRAKKKLRAGAGLLGTLELAASYPLQRTLGRRNDRLALEAVGALPRPPAEPRPEEALYVEAVNGPDAAAALEGLAPDAVVQFDAGILRPRIFRIPPLGTLNLHPGIAPLIRGRDPIYWALWEREPGWLGATIHYIDAGIDTGPVLAYAPVEPAPGDDYPRLFARVYEAGVAQLVSVLDRLGEGERWSVEPARGRSVYRTTFPGWRLALLRGAPVPAPG